jgi:hypothetical protein
MQTILAILKQAGGWHHGLYLRIEKRHEVVAWKGGLLTSSPLLLFLQNACAAGGRRRSPSCTFPFRNAHA